MSPVRCMLSIVWLVSVVIHCPTVLRMRITGAVLPMLPRIPFGSLSDPLTLKPIDMILPHDTLPDPDQTFHHGSATDFDLFSQLETDLHLQHLITARI